MPSMSSALFLPVKRAVSFILYELVDGEFKKLGKARTPKELEDKFEVSKRMRCAQ